jgi:hypothetical protein
MSDFPAMDWHDYTEAHRYWVRTFMRVKTARPISRNVGGGPIDRTFVTNYIAFVEAIFGTTERSRSGLSLTRHDA